MSLETQTNFRVGHPLNDIESFQAPVSALENIQMDEIWKRISGFPDYEISNQGRVRSFKMMSKGRILNPDINPNGYRRINLFNSGLKKHFAIHRLVLETFGTKASGPEYECRHLDGNKLNNKFSNLEWGTRVDNSADKIKHGTMYQGSKHHKSKLTEPDVLIIRTLYKSGYQMEKIASLFHLAKSTVSYVLNSKTWKHVK